MSKLFILLIFTFLILNTGYSSAMLEGQTKIDSLLKELPKSREDTNKVNLLNELSFNFGRINPDEGNKFAVEGLELAKKLKWKLGESKVLNSLGSLYYSKSDYSAALDYCKKALKISEELKNKNGIGKNLGNIGIIYSSLYDYPKALEYYQKALKIAEELNNQSMISTNLANIGVIYREQNDYTKALQYYHRALKISEEQGDKSNTGLTLGNIGNIYRDKTDYAIALQYYYRALNIAEELGDKSSIARNLGNIGNIFHFQFDYANALKFLHKALGIVDELGDKRSIGIWLGNIGGIYLQLTQDTTIIRIENQNLGISLNKQYNLEQALNYTNRAIEISKEIGDDGNLISCYDNLGKIYLQYGDYENAFKYNIKKSDLKDSVFSKEKTKEITILETKRENELKDNEIKILQAEQKAQKLQTYLLYGGILVFIGAFITAYIGFRHKKILSEILAVQKNEIEEQKDIVELQKSLVDEKNEQIYDSIRYASTIQHAILPWDSTLKNAFPEHFIFYKPKDIVSGDCYWFQEIDGIKFLAVIDCTGHGIPGSMLTVIASSVLDDAVLSKRLTDTGEILTYMNNKVTEVLNQRLLENQMKDGMELALVAISDTSVQFSGAGRPLYTKNGTFETLKTDRRGIAGQSEDNDYKFNTIEINKTENSILYLTTDGFPDQMNEDSKKYSTKRFVSLLESISDKPMEEQSQILEYEFNSHKGNRNQIDDITILGVKI